MKSGSNTLLLSENDQKILGEIDDDSISPDVRKHASRPWNLGSIENPDGQAALTGMCEDTVVIQLKLRGDIIVDSKFQTNGCGFTLACGSVATMMIKRKNIKVALGITGKKIDKVLGGLPKEHIHCADLAANAVKAAALDALVGSQNPWKRSYRKLV